MYGLPHAQSCCYDGKDGTCCDDEGEAVEALWVMGLLMTPKTKRPSRRPRIRRRVAGQGYPRVDIAFSAPYNHFLLKRGSWRFAEEVKEVEARIYGYNHVGLCYLEVTAVCKTQK